MKKSKRSKGLLFGFYRKKLLFFALLFISIGIGYKALTNTPLSADDLTIADGYEASVKNISVIVQENGNILIDGRKTGRHVDILDDSDEVRLVVLDNPGTYLEKVKISLKLPEDISSQVKHEFLAIHGVDDYSSKVITESEIIYIAQGIGPQATLSIIAELPKGVIKHPFYRQLVNALSNISQEYWIVIAITLPLITVMFMIGFLIKQYKNQKIDIPSQEANYPPMAIPPAIVGALYKQKVGPREIAATLIDLAIRGDIVIVDRERGFEFGKNKFDQRLLGFEKILLSKIFKKNIFSSKDEVEERINNHFYSRKISIVTSGIYALSTRLGYFKVNPQKIHAKYRFIGLSAFVIALAGFTLSLVVFTEPPYAIFFWIGMMISALAVSLLAKKIPMRTVIGQEVLSNWLAFKNYLSDPEPFPYSEENQAIFQKYLPYAIVLECEASWARRFAEHSFITPDWFLTDKNGLGLEDFCLSLFPIVSYVGKSLAALREPGFE